MAAFPTLLSQPVSLFCHVQYFEPMLLLTPSDGEEYDSQKASVSGNIIGKRHIQSFTAEVRIAVPSSIVQGPDMPAICDDCLTIMLSTVKIVATRVVKGFTDYS